VAINRVRPQFHIFTEHQFAQGLFGSLTERLAFLRRINKSDTDPDLLPGADQQIDRVAVDNTCYAPVDIHVFEAKSVCGLLERILAKNAKSTRKNKQGG